MEKIIIALVLIVFSVSIQAQTIKAKKIPAEVADAFIKTHPSVNEVNWSKDSVNYEADYIVKKVNKSVTYNASGKLVETETGIKISALPSSIIKYVKKKYKNVLVKKASKITDANGLITYEAEVNGIDLLFDAKGKFMK